MVETPELSMVTSPVRAKPDDQVGAPAPLEVSTCPKVPAGSKAVMPEPD